MQRIVFILSILIFSLSAFSEEILRATIEPLTKEDFNTLSKGNCKSFSKTLVEARNEWKHVIPYKLSQESLEYFVIGYNLQEKLVADIVTVWPSYQGRRDQYFVLIGNNNCFVKWIELLPNSIQEIIDNGVKAKI
jgi:hypothetical protein